MHPFVFGIPAFVVVLPFAVAAGLVVPLRLAALHGVEWRRVLLVLLLTTIIGLAGAKLYSVFERGEYGTLHDELGTGFRYPGGILAILLTAPLLRMLAPKRVSLATLADWIAPGIGVAMAVMRVHCLLSGCCTGWPCSHLWCLAYPHESAPFQYQMIDHLIAPSTGPSLPVHPLPIYFMFASLGCALFAFWFLPRAQYAGQTFLVFIALNEGAKFALEFVRYPAAPIVQLGSGMVAVAAVVALGLIHLRRQSDARTLRSEPLQVRERP